MTRGEIIISFHIEEFIRFLHEKSGGVLPKDSEILLAQPKYVDDYVEVEVAFDDEMHPKTWADIDKEKYGIR